MAEGRLVLTSKMEQMQKKLQQMQQRFRDGLDERFAEIGDVWAAIYDTPDNQDLIRQLHRLVHTLTGSAGTFQMSALSAKARELEIVLKTIVSQQDVIDPEMQSQVTFMLHEMVEASHEVDDLDLHNTIHEELDSPEANNRVLIVEDDTRLMDLLKFQFESFGYMVTSLDSYTQVAQMVEEFQPGLIICDITFPDNSLGGIEAIRSLHDQLGDSIPVIFISSRQDMEARLEAVRAGGVAYYNKPLNVPLLIDKAHSFTTIESQVPPQVLIVDDDVALTNFMQYVLQEAGMDVFVVNDPLEAMDMLAEHVPDLILMDFHMPGCNGVELARVIRQTPNYVGIPILFLSTDTDEKIQFEAMIEGGDDFLNKPIQTDVLSSIVRAKAKRARMIHQQMITDGLTGLFNHTYIENQLDREVERVHRTHGSLSMALLDIDFFKKVNDQYGHVTGDMVLRSLSHLLRKRLRKVDLIGRYGGEEFSIIMPDTTKQEAFLVLEDIRKVFEDVIHQSGDEEFHVTFSCGIASYPEYKTSSALTNASDKALYDAKEKGRNCIKLAE